MNENESGKHDAPNDSAEALDAELRRTLTGALANAVDDPPLDGALRARIRDRILERIVDREPEGTSTLRADEGAWVDYLPGIRRKVLRVDEALDSVSALYRLAPGARLPRHAHTQVEECLMLEGELRIGDIRVKAGDWHVAEPGSAHPELITDAGALFFLRSERFRLPHEKPVT
jgi:hypothetical protein